MEEKPAPAKKSIFTQHRNPLPGNFCAKLSRSTKGLFFTMKLAAKTSKIIPVILLLLAIVSILLVEMGFQTTLAQAEDQGEAQFQAPDPTKTKKQDKPTKTPVGGKLWYFFATPESHILCGELVYLTSFTKIKSNKRYTRPTAAAIGLRPCNSGNILIFDTHPRDLIRFYQFRDAKIYSGQSFCTAEYGCLNQHISSFKNYIGLESCAACGLSMLPPTWTPVPLTPYTPTPIPPTRTPWPTPVSPTPSPTLSAAEVTPTLSLFELLQGNETPSAQPSVASTPTARPTPTAASIASVPFYRRVGPLGLILLAVLAFLIPLFIVLRDILKERL